MSSAAVYAGTLVVDMTVAQQGPIASQILADYGATVIKVERPGCGDPMRGADAHGCQNGVPGGYGSAFLACNRNKQSLVLDLKQAEGRDLLVNLIDRAAVVVSNFRPGVMERLGLGEATLRARNPDIIYALASGYGSDGPYAQRKGQDMAAQCLGGLAAHSLRHSSHPIAAGYNVCDLIGGTLLAQGIMAALAARARGLGGQRVETNLLNAALFADIVGATAALNEPEHPPYAPNPTYAFYCCADSRWVHLIDAFVSDPLLRLCRALDLPEAIACGSRFANCNQLPPAHAEELSALIAQAAAQMESATLIARCAAQDMLAVPLVTLPEALCDPQVRNNGMVLSATLPNGQPGRMLGFPVRLSATPATLRQRPPLLGEHSASILREHLGLESDDLADLRERGVWQDVHTEEHE
jgi:crotonobetainyl-CoA:carnitine CoA-transferase CaiB-like acyl-CoA transferase